MFFSTKELVVKAQYHPVINQPTNQPTNQPSTMYYDSKDSRIGGDFHDLISWSDLT